jgi:hypothetical protein
MTRRLLALWSVPRARSTAFLRMMAERGDLTVVHEPFSRITFFGTVAVAGRTCKSATDVMRALQELADERPVFSRTPWTTAIPTSSPTLTSSGR